PPNTTTSPGANPWTDPCRSLLSEAGASVYMSAPLPGHVAVIHPHVMYKRFTNSTHCQPNPHCGSGPLRSVASGRHDASVPVYGPFDRMSTPIPPIHASPGTRT